ncbi:hypothetical protein NCCP2716_07980 [Sporosarcina sp. NCCP-2716]|nr:hypothetical protein NCCP2716_07980 [Sporosarcina sp. NCCP-2716]
MLGRQFAGIVPGSPFENAVLLKQDDMLAGFGKQVCCSQSAEPAADDTDVTGRIFSECWKLGTRVCGIEPK